MLLRILEVECLKIHFYFPCKELVQKFLVSLYTFLGSAHKGRML